MSELSMFSNFVGIKPMGPIIVPHPRGWMFGISILLIIVAISIHVYYRHNEKCVLSKIHRLMAADATMKDEDCVPVKSAKDRCASKVFQADPSGAKKSRNMTVEFGPASSNLVYIVDGDECLELVRENNLLLWNGTPVFRIEESEGVGFKLYVVEVDIPEFKVTATNNGIQYEVQDDKFSKVFVYDSEEKIPHELRIPVDSKGSMVFFENKEVRTYMRSI